MGTTMIAINDQNYAIYDLDANFCKTDHLVHPQNKPKKHALESAGLIFVKI